MYIYIYKRVEIVISLTTDSFGRKHMVMTTLHIVNYHTSWKTGLECEKVSEASELNLNAEKT